MAADEETAPEDDGRVVVTAVGVLTFVGPTGGGLGGFVVVVEVGVPG